MGDLIAAHASSVQLTCTSALVMPVPLHWIRYFRRGHNQAAGIARQFAYRVGAECFSGGLLRVRHTRSQTTRSMEERPRNVRDAFTVLDPRRVVDRNIIVIDDVTTTGATLQAVAIPLLRAGASRVLCLTAAGG
jgi:predicted amidophosphoribosyltransferase